MQPSITDDDHPWSLYSICRRLTSCRQIGGQKIAGMLQSMTKSHPDLLITMMIVFKKFEINPLGYVSGNVWTPWKCDGWTDRWVNSRMNGRTSKFLCQWRMSHQVYLPTPVRLWFFTQSPSNYYSLLPHVIKCGLNKVCVIFLTSSNSFCLKSLFFKFHWTMILISWLMISQHWFSQACHLC